MAELMPFNQFRDEFMRLYALKDFQAARDWLRLGGGQFPQRAALLFFWHACLMALMKEPVQAVQILAQGVDLGLWWSESFLRRDPDLASLQGLAEFEHLIPTCRQRHQAAEAQSQAELLVYAPADVFQPPYPTLLALHSRGTSAAEMAEPFFHLNELGWLIAVVQSSQLAYPGGYLWDDRSRARQDILDLLPLLAEKHPLDPQRTLLAGFSQGGGLAIELGLSGDLAVVGVLALSPYLAQLPETAASRPGIWISRGERDLNREMFDRIAQRLEQLKLRHRLESFPELGHDFPPDFPSILNQALAFLLDEDHL